MSDLTLREKQELHCYCKALLIIYANTVLGYTLTSSRGAMSFEANRTMGSNDKSLHPLRLAEDFNLYIDGVWQTETEAHAPLGRFWKDLHPLCRWGGDFVRPDGNHYSIEHEGRA